jgi:hypothetical protein
VIASSGTFIDASARGFKRAATAKLSGGDPDDNARMTEAVLRGSRGRRRDVVLLNAAAALLVAGAVEQMEDGIERAALTIDAGLASELSSDSGLSDGWPTRRESPPGRRQDGGPPPIGRIQPRRSTQRRRADRGRGAAPTCSPRRTHPGRVLIERRADAAPCHATVVERFAAPGLHLIAEIKRASPSAGRSRRRRRSSSPVPGVRARWRAAISVLCEPHWFRRIGRRPAGRPGGRRAPVLAKDFVVEEIQLPMLRAAGADLVLLLAVLHPPSDSPGSSIARRRSVWSRWSRSTTRANSSAPSPLERG